MTKNQTVAQYKAEIELLNEKLRIAKSLAKITKTDSEYFWNKRKNIIQSWSGLSETKKYFEINHPDFCKKISEGNPMTGDVFHSKIAELLGL